MFRYLCVLATLLAFASLSPALALAQTYKQGDEIEVFHFKEWVPGVVISTNPRGQVMAEYTWGNGGHTRRDTFSPQEVRFAYESGALARGRTWADPSGKFKVKAAILGIEGEVVRLRKQDMTELNVPIAKLSDTDKAFLKKMEKQLGPIAPKEVEIEQFEEPLAYGAQAWLQESRVALSPDPLPSSIKLKQGGIVIPMANFWDRLGNVVTYGGPDAGLLAVVVDGQTGGSNPSRLVWASLSKQKVIGYQSLPTGEDVLDYHEASRRLLTCSQADGGRSIFSDMTLTLWDVGPADKQPKAVVRWRVGAKGYDGNWARLIDGDTVLHRRERQEYVVWDAKGKQLRYVLPQESFFSAGAVLSGGRRYLVLPEDKRVRILEAASGKLICSLPAPSGSSAVAVSPDGTKLAVLDRNKITVWDLTSADAAPEVHPAESIGTPFSADLAWVSADTVAVSDHFSNLVLFSLKMKMPLWNYQFDMNAVREWPGQRLREILDGHLVYVASVGWKGSNQSLAVGAVSLPGPKVNEVAAATPRQSLLIMQRGAEVSLNVTAGDHQAEVEAALAKQIEQNGWVLRPGAANVLTAEMKQGETQNITYTRGDGATQSVSITPYISSLRLKVGDADAWQSSTQSGAPSIIHLRDGETAQGEADKWNRPNPQFFSSVSIPESILDPKRKNGLGTTYVTNRGLIPKPPQAPNPAGGPAGPPSEAF